jgi:hypothetical protein
MIAAAFRIFAAVSVILEKLSVSSAKTWAAPNLARF